LPTTASERSWLGRMGWVVSGVRARARGLAIGSRVGGTPDGGSAWGHGRLLWAVVDRGWL